MTRHMHDVFSQLPAHGGLPLPDGAAHVCAVPVPLAPLTVLLLNCVSISEGS